MQKENEIKRLFLLKWFAGKYLKNYWLWYLLAFILFIGQDTVQLGYAILLKPILDNLGTSGNTAVLSRYAVVYLCMFIPLLLISAAAYLLVTKTNLSLERRIRESLFGSVIFSPLSNILNRQSGYLSQRLLDDVDLCANLTASGTFASLASFITTLFVFGVLLSLSPKLTMIALLSYPLHLVNLLVLSPKLQPAAMRRQEARAQLSSRIQEFFSGIFTIRAFAVEKEESKLCYDGHHEYLNKKWGYVTKETVIGLVIPAIIQCPVWGLLVWLGIKDVKTGILSVGGFVAFFMLSFQTTGPISAVFQLSAVIQQATAGLQRIYNLFSESKPGTEEKAPKKKWFASLHACPGILLRNISFSYPAGKNVVDGLDMDILPGRTTVIIGPSGCGKSTLLNILLKIYRPQKGAIQIDKNDYSNVDGEYLRKSLGIMTQETFLFNRSIKDNLHIAKPDAEMDELSNACKLAGIHDFIDALPNGYQTSVGERGQLLSIGQKQRIGLARLFLKNPNFILMDEPTSSLDVATESQIISQLDIICKKRTTVIVTHRAALSLLADHVYIMQNGKITGHGKHDDLIMESPFYRNFHNINVVG